MDTSVRTPGWTIEPYDLTLADSPQYYSIYPINSFDSSPGLQIKLIEPETITEGVRKHC
ncbi:MAG: hypothetical protein R2883_08170 [Caldisericia bacterium]